jgi:hypothetical protein
MDPCAYIMKRNGAYLIWWVGELTADLGTVDAVDVASSIQTARRIAKMGAKELGYKKLFWGDEESANTLFGEGEW